MKILPSPTKFRPSSKPAITILDCFVVSLLTSIPPQLAPLPPPSFTPNSITVLLSVYYNLPRPKSQITSLQQIQNSLACAVLKAPQSCHITPILCSLHWLQITQRIEYKLLSLTYKILTTTQPPYLHNLISVQPPRSNGPPVSIFKPLKYCKSWLKSGHHSALDKPTGKQAKVVEPDVRHTLFG